MLSHRNVQEQYLYYSGSFILASAQLHSITSGRVIIQISTPDQNKTNTGSQVKQNLGHSSGCSVVNCKRNQVKHGQDNQVQLNIYVLPNCNYGIMPILTICPC